VESAQKAGAKVVGISTTHTAEELNHTDFVTPNFIGLTPERLFATVFNIG
jgi:phosphoglycolate phosphatase-like HAD superfamily hydrolase